MLFVLHLTKFLIATQMRSCFKEITHHRELTEKQRHKEPMGNYEITFTPCSSKCLDVGIEDVGNFNAQAEQSIFSQGTSMLLHCQQHYLSLGSGRNNAMEDPPGSLSIMASWILCMVQMNPSLCLLIFLMFPEGG